MKTRQVHEPSTSLSASDGGISICLPTYRRPDRLQRTLEDIACQTLLPSEVVVVDNDANASARAVVDAFALHHQGTFVVKYAVQPEKNIALTRNMTLALADSPWLAFIDDDERASPTWLQNLLHCANGCRAMGVLAPVIPTLPDSAPKWLRESQAYECPRFPTGTIVPLNRMRIGNALLHRSLFAGEDPAFDPAYGVTGGSDSDLLIRLARKGGRIVWCDEALVYEPVEPARMRLGWILKRHMRGGQDYARHFLKGRLTDSTPSVAARLLFFGRALAQMLVALALAGLSLPFGRHHAVYWLTKTWANFGKLAVSLGWHYKEYA